MMTTLTPLSASSRAAVRPLGPPPITITSVSAYAARHRGHGLLAEELHDAPEVGLRQARGVRVDVGDALLEHEVRDVAPDDAHVPEDPGVDLRRGRRHIASSIFVPLGHTGEARWERT